MNARRLHAAVLVAMMLLFTEAGLARIEPVGAWSCVLYGPDKETDERMVLEFLVDGSTRIAELGGDSYTWAPISGWDTRRGYLEFADPRNGRDFIADLDYVSLGGIWSDDTYSGGWWCAPLAQAPNIDPRGRSFNEFSVMPRLIVDVTATPWYPRVAIREATEGYAVVCFLVKPDGFIIDPHFIELSDEVFREAALGALSRSHYRPWDEALPHRPACRTYDFHLDGRRLF